MSIHSTPVSAVAELVRKTAMEHFFVRKFSSFKISLLHEIISFPETYFENQDTWVVATSHCGWKLFDFFFFNFVLFIV